MSEDKYSRSNELETTDKMKLMRQQFSYTKNEKYKKIKDVYSILRIKLFKCWKYINIIHDLKTSPRSSNFFHFFRNDQSTQV